MQGYSTKTINIYIIFGLNNSSNILSCIELIKIECTKIPKNYGKIRADSFQVNHGLWRQNSNKFVENFGLTLKVT